MSSSILVLSPTGIAFSSNISSPMFHVAVHIVQRQSIACSDWTASLYSRWVMPVLHFLCCHWSQPSHWRPCCRGLTAFPHWIQLSWTWDIWELFWELWNISKWKAATSISYIYTPYNELFNETFLCRHRLLLKSSKCKGHYWFETKDSESFNETFLCCHRLLLKSRKCKGHYWFETKDSELFNETFLCCHRLLLKSSKCKGHYLLETKDRELFNETFLCRHRLLLKSSECKGHYWFETKESGNLNAIYIIRMFGWLIMFIVKERSPRRPFYYSKTWGCFLLLVRLV